MVNYLLCQSYNEKDGKYVPSTMRLCRIFDPKVEPTSLSLLPEIQELLDEMIDRSPQYTIYDYVESRVLLTKRGMNSFSQIYFGRPACEKKEPLSDDHCIYVFNSSMNQLYLYFRRFNAEDAIVLSPPDLVEKIKTFHEKAWKAYDHGKTIKD